jgi:hypothetical protein
LRTNAKKRHIQFELTLEDFREFCLETSYHLKSGVEADSLTVDRKDPNGSYNKDNIRPLGHLANSTRQDSPHLERGPQGQLLTDLEEPPF